MRLDLSGSDSDNQFKNKVNRVSTLGSMRTVLPNINKRGYEKFGKTCELSVRIKFKIVGSLMLFKSIRISFAK